MNALSGLDLLTGVIPLSVGSAAAAAGLYLLIRRGRSWWMKIAAAVPAAALLALGTSWFLVHVAAVSAQELPSPITGWIGIACLAVLLAGLNLTGTGWRRKIIAPVAMAVLILGAALEVNAYFGAYRTLGDLTGASTAAIQTLPAGARRVPGTADQPGPGPKGASLAATWVKPAGLPAAGTINSVQIPGAASGFVARSAYVYLPPAYQADTGPALPVLVLVAGQPGSPVDWVVAGGVKTAMDNFAAAHNGLAPVVVIPDVNGSATGNTMCMDSRIAKAGTYLSTDVPAWIKATLRVDPDPTRWAIGGFSFGGTCALQMASLHPDVYASAIDLSGEAEPALGPDRAATVGQAFGGDTAAFDAVVPLHVLATGHYTHSRIYLAAGAQDGTFAGYQARVADAATRAGMDVTTALVAGQGHSWEVPRQSLAPAMDWLAPILGLSG
ncbi:alpha/beta hydrolase-fold protein [Pseudarthrobacter sp. PH31-O2]|uniref:alpha/beta hydrolase n=1 Tax=Pseudarthrobacter sp. PH31-O2 TaxID=3046206 RepID=UPI0024B885AE|nr:alpha/beta hydrolase-fold protein [Pseudarthrobacter sp. PH31-O2]MDJ0354320.1 alpha/beta hydrolase-fold protein [Pseudarthrobacter sp. PH31-O2]